MAWSNIDVYNLMERWKTRVNVNPYSFQQINDGFMNYSPAVWVQDERNELALTLSIEIQKFNKWVGYNPFPIYGVETIWLNGLDWENVLLVLSDSVYLQKFGTLGQELLGTESISYNGDVATITITTDELDDDEQLAIYPPDYTAQLNYRIHDVKHSYSGGVYTITGHKSNFVDPDKQLEIDSFVNGDYKNRNELDESDADNFLTDVDIYRHYNDTTTQAELICYGTGDTAVTTTSVTPVIINGRESKFVLARNSNTSISGMVQAVRIYYQAGYPLQNNETVFEPFETIILRQTKANLGEKVQQLIFQSSAIWQSDMEVFIDNPSGILMMQNPIGLRNVDYFTWIIYRNWHDKLYGEARNYV